MGFSVFGRCLLFSVYIYCVLGHDCGHSVPKRHEVLHDVHLEPAHVMRKRSLDQQLRIYLQYDSSVEVLPTDKLNLVKHDLIPKAVEYWENTLQVRQTAGPIKLLRQCKTDSVRYRINDMYMYCVDGCSLITKCGETVVPGEHLDACRVAPGRGNYSLQGYAGAGVDNADFILYVSAYSTKRCGVGTTVAYAAYCQLEGALDRPVAGYVNLCPESISVRAHDIHQMHSMIKHEILHALGFSAGLYAFFRDSKGVPLTDREKASRKPPFNDTLQLYQWSDRVVKIIKRPRWRVKDGFVSKTIQMIVTPTVKEEVRKHFNCSDLEGAELEDQGMIGTALTHWEKRIFENEVMTGTYTQNPLISRITLAFMEDTGWYRVNYDMADPWMWGKDLGCDFVKNSCLSWMQKRQAKKESIHPFCNRVKMGPLRTECTDHRDAVALCNLVQFNKRLPRQYQYFGSLTGVDQEKTSKYGGNVALADYCPYIQEFSWKKDEVVTRGSGCGIHQNNADPRQNYALEAYGNSSKCFDQAYPWEIRHCDITHQVKDWGSGCYKYNCTPDGLAIVVKGQQYQCFREGQVLDIAITSDDWLHKGAIICPSCSSVCHSARFPCPPESDPPQVRRSVSAYSAPCCASVESACFISLMFIAIISSHINTECGPFV